MVGRPEDGPGIEGAPVCLLERVSAFLSQQRAKLRHELDNAQSGATTCISTHVQLQNHYATNRINACSEVAASLLSMDSIEANIINIFSTMVFHCKAMRVMSPWGFGRAFNRGGV